MIVSVTSLEIDTLPEITLSYDTGDLDNVAVGDDNIYRLFCDDIGSVCNVYRTDNIHTTLTGD